MTVKPIPEGYHTVTPYLIVDGAARVLDFAKQAFGAEERGGRFQMPDGSIGHAEMTIGDSIVMVADASTSDQGKAMPSVVHLYVEDVDSVYARAIEAGASSLREPANQFYGDRNAGVTDPVGDQWWMSTRVEDVSQEEMMKRLSEQSS
ncbi:MAG: VOC family protein [Actinomycetota bacterium]